LGVAQTLRFLSKGCTVTSKDFRIIHRRSRRVDIANLIQLSDRFHKWHVSCGNVWCMTDETRNAVTGSRAESDIRPPDNWRLIKLLVSLMFYGTCSICAALLTALRRESRSSFVAIYYHQVLAAQRERFARQMDHVVRWTQTITPDFSTIRQGAGRYLVITADDGWKSFEENALPELRRRNIPVTLFAISDKLGRSIDNVKGDRIVSEAELREFVTANAAIGSHTATHAALTRISREDAMSELRRSRERLSRIVGAPINLFCFPYGECNDALIDLARQAGYERVLTTMPERARPEDFAVGRVRVDPSDWPLEFHLKIMGAYRWIPAALSLKRKIRRAGRRRPRPASNARRIARMSGC
jgi:peptidoglycan/xylan/chitin deacetylase (PgdA/CDA1 family)